MASNEGEPEQACLDCGHLVGTAGLEPFSKISCPACGAQIRVERVFENYQVVEPLGAGGMGSVFKARDTRLNRFVALKLLRRELASDPSFTAKLQEEARITASINHRHVVEVYSVGQDHGQFYVVMELVDGGSLDDRIEDEKHLSEMRTLELGLQVAKGLQAALTAGLIHRDIKPGNILFADAETAKIVDFGLAHLAEQRAENTGEIWGTPYYVAPERLTGEPEDFRSDLYSLGATLFHVASGRTTFTEETHAAAELKRLKANPISLRLVAPHISEETSAVIDKMLRPDPADRHASYKELINELRSARALVIAREEELRARWSWPVRIAVSLGVICLTSALIFGAMFGLRHLPKHRSLTNADVTNAAAEATPEVDVSAQIAPARRELQADHYAEAEALFRQIADTASNVRPIADLCAALQLWEHEDFAGAATAFAQFLKFNPPPRFAWMREYHPLAQERLNDYRVYENWERERVNMPNDPEKILARLRAVEGQLKAKGALSFRLADEDAALTTKVAAASKERDAAEKEAAETERPKLKAALAAIRPDYAVYKYSEAAATLKKLALTSAAIRAELDTETKRAQWLATWKSKLIADINSVGYGGVVTDVHGVRYDGPVQRTTATQMELKTRYGGVMVNWLNLSPQMLLTMSSAFIRPGAGDMAEREWLCANFAAATGQAQAAIALATKAAAGNAQFRDLLVRYFPDAKK